MFHGAQKKRKWWKLLTPLYSGTWLERQETYGNISGDCVRQGARRSLLDAAQVLFDILRKLLSRQTRVELGRMNIRE